MRLNIIEDQVVEIEGCNELARLLQQKINGKCALAFQALMGPDRDQ